VAKADLRDHPVYSNLKLLLIGDSAEEHSDLRRAVLRSRVQGDVRFLGFVPHPVLRVFYSRASAFLFPSLYEGFGLPPLEAMACGAPVIVSRISALVETTGDAAWLFDPESVGDLARNILELVDDDNSENKENARRRLSIVGQRRAAEFSWENTARLTWNVYEEALRRFRRE